MTTGEISAQDYSSNSSLSDELADWAIKSVYNITNKKVRRDFTDGFAFNVLLKKISGKKFGFQKPPIVKEEEKLANLNIFKSELGHRTSYKLDIETIKRILFGDKDCTLEVLLLLQNLLSDSDLVLPNEGPSRRRFSTRGSSEEVQIFLKNTNSKSRSYYSYSEKRTDYPMQRATQSVPSLMTKQIEHSDTPIDTTSSETVPTSISLASESETRLASFIATEKKFSTEAPYVHVGKLYLLGIFKLSHQEAVSSHEQSLSKFDPFADHTKYLESLGLTNNLDLPLSLVSFGEDIKSVRCGSNNIMALNTSGQVFTMGAPQLDYFALGIKRQERRTARISEKGEIPVYNLSIKRLRKQTVQGIDSGLLHSVAFTSTDKIISWGYNINCSVIGSNKQIQTGDTTDSANFEVTGQLGSDSKKISRPKIVDGIKGVPLQVATGSSHTLVLTDKGIWGFGLNAEGQLGIGSNFNAVIPCQVHVQTRIERISCGSHHSAAIDATGSPFTWGFNNRGQLGTAKYDSINVPTKVAYFAKYDTKSISCGSCHTMLLNMSGGVYSWGDNTFGQLGRSTKHTFTHTPKNIKEFVSSEDKVRKIHSGSYSCVALTQCGYAFIWGELCAKGLTSHSNTPRIVHQFHDRYKYIADADAGHTHFAFLDNISFSSYLQDLHKAVLYDTQSLTLPELKKTITDIPIQYFKPLQSRVHEQISSEVDQYPLLQIREYFLEISDVEDAVGYIVITNKSSKPISITLSFSLTDNASNFVVESKKVTIKGKKTHYLEIMKQEPDDCVDIITLLARCQSKDGPIVQYFICVQSTEIAFVESSTSESLVDSADENIPSMDLPSMLVTSHGRQEFCEFLDSLTNSSSHLYHFVKSVLKYQQLEPGMCLGHAHIIFQKFLRPESYLVVESLASFRDELSRGLRPKNEDSVSTDFFAGAYAFAHDELSKKFTQWQTSEEYRQTAKKSQKKGILRPSWRLVS